MRARKIPKLVRFAIGLAIASASMTRAQPAPSEGGALRRVDIAVAIDVSESTRAASGIDVNGNGLVGINPTLDPRLDDQYPDGVVSTDPADTVLAAELAAVRALLAKLAGIDARIAIVAFSGAIDAETGQQLGSGDDNAEILAPLSADREAAGTALDEIARRGSHGGTDFSAAIRTARHALCGSRVRPDAERVLLLLTDGLPSLPHGFAARTDHGDVSAALTEAREASACAVRIDVFAIGLLAIGDPYAAQEVARVSGGRYRPIYQPADLRAALERTLDVSVPDRGDRGRRW